MMPAGPLPITVASKLSIIFKNDVQIIMQNNDEAEKEYELKEAFKIFDKNQNDSISVEELTSVFRSLGYNFSHKDIDEMVKEYKADVQELTFEDFKQLLLMQEQKAKSGEDDLRDAFEVFDRDANGYITMEELMIVTKSLGERLSEEDLRGMIAYAAQNGEQVSLKDFVEVFLVRAQTYVEMSVDECILCIFVFIK